MTESKTPAERLADYLYDQHFETCEHYCGFTHESAMERAQWYLDVAAGADGQHSTENGTELADRVLMPRWKRSAMVYRDEV